MNLADDRRLQRALEAWQPHFLNWWREMGPEGFQGCDVYLRTATSADARAGRPSDTSRCRTIDGEFFSPTPSPIARLRSASTRANRSGARFPGEHRGVLRRLIVTQGDTEPASVEQQRHLGRTCPSLYDLRNLFQVNVEEGRHLWAMVYLLHAYFGRDGREEAEALASAPLGQRRQSAHSRRVQREDARLALLLHVYPFHRSRRQVSAREPRRIRIRSARRAPAALC